MGQHETAYRSRIAAAFEEIEREQPAPSSAEAALQEFFALMDAVAPVLEAFPRPVSPDNSEPDELGLYRRWREREARRSRHA